MTQEQHSGLATLTIEYDLYNKIDFKGKLKEFAEIKKLAFLYLIYYFIITLRIFHNCIFWYSY